MRTADLLNSYIEQIKKRLRMGALLRGTAILTSAALAVTLLLVLITNAFAFSPVSITGARVTLFLALALAVGFGLAVPLYGLDRRRAAGKAEAVFPQFQQRLLTFTERSQGGGREPFIDLLAADTLEIASQAEPSHLVTDRTLLTSLAAGVASLGVLIWMIVAGPGFLGHGAALLWVGTAHAGAPIYDLQVAPGDAAVRRNTNQLVTAEVRGIQTPRVTLYARYQSASKWEQVSMLPQPSGPGFQFLFAGLPEDVEYYVEAGPLRSEHFNIRVVDLPAVEQIRVIYRYPSWTGLQNVVEEHGGDLRAYEGTLADLEILMDRPLRDGLLVVNDQQKLPLSGGEGNLYKGTIPIERDGIYHVAGLDQGQQVRLSNDYFIEARKANPPEIRVARPGGDYRASSIEEVTIVATAAGEFALNNLILHYSVNGEPEQTVNLLQQKGVKEAEGSTTLSLEDFNLVPGDLVSFYATAKDARAEARTDMFFIETQPFEREYMQSQQMGGGGGMGGADQTEISQRQKEIIAATWKQQGDKIASKEAAAEAGRFLSSVQATLRDQALSLAGRLQRRALTRQNEEFSDFQKDMNAAAEAMGPASEKLQQQKWAEALSDEQKALQHLLRAEATFRQISVAFGSRGGGGGAGRDLASLFDLELDTEKNQYETGQTTSSAEQRQKDIDEALQKLEQLARREQDLADQLGRGGQNVQEQRWQQEMLRREAEELQRQMEQLARNGQQGSQSGASGSAGRSGAADPRIQQTLERLRQANEDMRRAASGGQSAADARRAAARLNEATDLLSGLRQQQASEQLDSIVSEADRLSGEQREQAERMRQMFGQVVLDPSGRPLTGPIGTPEEQGQLAEDRLRTTGDYAQLERQMQDAVRDLAAGQRAASSKLRDALGEAQQNDLRNRLQRSGNWIRRGLGAYSNLGEPNITSSMERLNDQVRQAQQALGNTQPSDQQGIQSALERVESLRNQVQTLARGQAGQQGQQGGSAGGSSDGTFGGWRWGRYDGGLNPGLNPGFVAPQGPETQPSPPPSPAEIARVYQEAMGDLNRLRQEVGDQPEPLADIQSLIREMQGLDPSRFPGDPALVEQLYSQVLLTLDKVELELRRQLEDNQPGQIHSGNSQPVPSGYRESVAEYFRRLSKRQQQ